jgi:hypothetical protein
LLALLALPLGAAAQHSEPALTFGRHIVGGYCVNAPDQLLGLNLYSLPPKGRTGFYLDLKLPVRGIGLPKAGHYYSANLAATRVLARKIAGYIGVGLTTQPPHEGNTAVSAEEPRTYALNVLGGIMVLAAPRLLAQLGAEMSPPGVTVGLGLVLWD